MDEADLSNDPKVLLNEACAETAECLFYKNILEECSKKIENEQKPGSNCIEEFFKYEKCIDFCV